MEENKVYTGGCGGWGGVLGAGFGGFLGSLLGNNGILGNNGGGAAAATMAAANAGTESLSRQILAGQQESQMQSSIAGVNSRIDGISGQIASQSQLGAIQGGFGTLSENLNSIAREMQGCCCQQKQLTLEQGYQSQLNNERQTNTIQAGFSNIGYLIQQQAQMLAASGTANTQKILDWLCNSKQLEQATTIQQLRDEVGRLTQTQTIINAMKTTPTAGA